MQPIVMPLTLAPVVTGHPLGLPEPRRAPKPSVEITPISKRGDIDAAIADARTPAEFWRAVSGQPHADHEAPRSMLQIRISQLLQEAEGADSDASGDGTPETSARATPDEDWAPDTPPMDDTRDAGTSDGTLRLYASIYEPLPDRSVPTVDKAS